MKYYFKFLVYTYAFIGVNYILKEIYVKSKIQNA